MLVRGVICVLLLFFGAALAEEIVWDYPQPDAGRDVKDLSFYQKPDTSEIPVNHDSIPRNVILMIGDGMGFNHVALARYAAVGAAGRVHMERLPVTGVMRTHSANALVTDSAAAATAMACGVKTDNGRIGMDADKTPYISILLKARSKGYRTGLVATSAITHATPAGFAAHVESRGQEADIAAQLIDSRVDILFGGGRRLWLPEPDGTRSDGRNLVREARAAGYQIAYNAEQMNAITPGPAIGLFADGEMTTFAPEPMLGAMTHRAIELLSETSEVWFAPEPKFMMMVEGSQIDWAGHANDTASSIRQMLLFDMAVKEAVEFARRDKKTLVIVTADHETGGLLIEGTLDAPQAKWTCGNHTAGDVPIYAFGPGAARFAGTLDNTDIAKRIAALLGFDNFPAPAAAEKTVLEHVAK